MSTWAALEEDGSMKKVQAALHMRLYHDGSSFSGYSPNCVFVFLSSSSFLRAWGYKYFSFVDWSYTWTNRDAGLVMVVEWIKEGGGGIKSVSVVLSIVRAGPDMKVCVCRGGGGGVWPPF